jgi:hypothetical protein
MNNKRTEQNYIDDLTQNSSSQFLPFFKLRPYVTKPQDSTLYDLLHNLGHSDTNFKIDETSRGCPKVKLRLCFKTNSKIERYCSWAHYKIRLTSLLMSTKKPRTNSSSKIRTKSFLICACPHRLLNTKMRLF